MQVNWTRDGVERVDWACIRGFYTTRTASGIRCPHIVILDCTGAQYMTASVNVPDHFLQEGEVIIKNYSENEGILKALVEAGVVEPPHAKVRCGYVKADLCRMTYTFMGERRS